MFILWLRQLSWCGDQTPASVAPPAEGRSSPTNTTVFLPSSFVLPSFASFYIFFFTGHELLSTLSWCSACSSVWRCIPVVSMERDVLYVHLLLCHLVLLSLLFNMLSRYHNFSSMKQESFNFMATVTICSDFGAQENKVCILHRNWNVRYMNQGKLEMVKRRW